MITGRPAITSRVGETKLNRYNMRMTVIRYGKYSDIDVEFEDGYISYNKSYKEFKSGKLVSMYEREKRTYKQPNPAKIYEPIENLKGEIWRDVYGYDGFYEISNMGRCITHHAKGSSKYTKQGRLKNKVFGSNGYAMYSLHKDGTSKSHLTHRLVAQAFISNPQNKSEVNHKDEDISNNNVDNLEWVTSKENANYGTRNIRSTKNHNYNKIVQLTLEYQFVAIHENSRVASEKVGLGGGSCIIRCCKGYNNQSKGYKWMYEKDYLNMMTRGED